MNLNKLTLIEFEEERRNFNFFPPLKSNSFYYIDHSKIDLYYYESDGYNVFDLTLLNNQCRIGDGEFALDPNLYRHMEVGENNELIIDGTLIVNSSLSVKGTLRLLPGSHLLVTSIGSVWFYQSSIFNIEEGATIELYDGCKFNTYGTINTHLSQINNVLYNPLINIDNTTIINVFGIDLKDRDFTVTDYFKYLSNININKYTQGEYSTKDGMIGYTWKHGDPNTHTQCLNIDIIQGNVIMGDFKLSILGSQNEIITGLQVIENLNVLEDGILHITEEYDEKQYLYPTLYLGLIVSNSEKVAEFHNYGVTIVDGENASIQIDYNAQLYIEADSKLYLKNDAKIISLRNDTSIIHVDGELILDNIDQISNIKPEEIVFGENGKIIILNPTKDEEQILLSIPNGIKSSLLYNLFSDRLDKVEFHISKNTGIFIDQYFVEYKNEMIDWYNGKRLEDAIKDKNIIWEDGGFIKLNQSIIPWVSIDNNLLQASRLFDNSGSVNEATNLQDVVNNFKDAGSGNIEFHFETEDDVKKVTLNLDGIKASGIIYDRINNAYVLSTDQSGLLFITNSAKNTKEDEVINDKSIVINLHKGDNLFNI